MTLIIGICGPSSSGKSTLAKEYCARNDYTHIRQDDYFLNTDDMPRITINGTDVPNWDCPESLDLDSIAHDLSRLSQGEDTNVPTYSKRQGKRIDMRVAYATPVIICEGHLLYVNDTVRDSIPVRIFIDAPVPVLRHRRFARQPNLSQEYYDRAVVAQYEPFRDIQRALCDLFLDGQNDLENLYEEIDTIIRSRTNLI